MISHRHKVIFIHIPKTAGTSIEAALGHDAVQDHRSLRALRSPHGGWAQFSSADNLHEVASGLAHFLRPLGSGHLATSVSRAQYSSYFKFSVVRNPWDRVFSWYRNVTRDHYHRERLGLPIGTSFAQFVADYSGVDLLRPQLHWIVDFRGEIGLDFVCRFETLDRDIAEVGRRAGLPTVHLPHLLPSDGPHYTSAYDSDTRRLIANRYRREIQLLGYSFGD